MTTRLFACGTKVCCGPCPGEFGIQLRRTTCPDSPCQSWGWWIPNFTGAAYAEIVYTEGCGATVTESANIEVWHIIPTGGCESSPETGAWIPSVKNYCDGDPECENVDPDPTELTFFDADDVPIAYYTKNTGGIPGSTTTPHPTCPLTGDLTYSAGGDIGSISASESAQYIPDWPCQITLETYPICSSTNIIYRLTDSSKQALEDACVGCTVSSVTLSDDIGNSQTLSLSDLGPQIGCTEDISTFNGALSFTPTKVAISTPFNTPPVYNIVGGCVGYIANVSIGSFCGANLPAKFYRQAVLPCPGVAPNEKVVTVNNADIPPVVGSYVTAVSVTFQSPSSTLGLNLIGAGIRAFYKDIYLEDCDEITGSIWWNYAPSSTGTICSINVTYYNPSVGSQVISYYANGCGCSMANVKKATITEYPLVKQTSVACGVLGPYGAGSSTSGTSVSTITVCTNPDDHYNCPAGACNVQSTPGTINVNISMDIAFAGAETIKLLEFNEAIGGSSTAPNIAVAGAGGGVATFSGTISKAACSNIVNLVGTITTSVGSAPVAGCGTYPSYTCIGATNSVDIAEIQLLPAGSKIKVRVNAIASSNSGCEQLILNRWCCFLNGYTSGSVTLIAGTI